MIQITQFPTLLDAVTFFNAPANATARLISVLPPQDGLSYIAVYEIPGEATFRLHEERIRVLSERMNYLIKASSYTKRALGFPAVVLDQDVVPLSALNNKLNPYVCFKGMNTSERAEWIRTNAPAIQCSITKRGDAQELYGCSVELVVVGR